MLHTSRTYYAITTFNVRSEYIDLSATFYFYYCYSYVKTVTETMLTFASPYWISNVLLLLATFLTGRMRIVTPKFVPDSFWEIISKYNVSLFLVRE